MPRVKPKPKIKVLCPKCKTHLIDLDQKEDRFIICKDCGTKMLAINPEHTIDGKLQLLRFDADKDNYNIEPSFEEY